MGKWASGARVLVTCENPALYTRSGCVHGKVPVASNRLNDALPSAHLRTDGGRCEREYKKRRAKWAGRVEFGGGMVRMRDAGCGMRSAPTACNPMRKQEEEAPEHRQPLHAREMDRLRDDSTGTRRTGTRRTGTRVEKARGERCVKLRVESTASAAALVRTRQRPFGT